MANRNSAGFGLRPAGTLGNTPATQGLSQYWIDAGASVDLFNGMAMKSSGGYMITGESATTVTTIGVLFGIYYTAATTKKPTWAHWYDATITPANSEDLTAFVLDNPFQLFVVATDGAIAQAGYGKTYGVTVTAAGSEISGQSSSTLTTGTVSNTANQWRLLRSAEDPSNNESAAYRSVVVAHNLNQYLQNTGTAGITWQ